MDKITIQKLQEKRDASRLSFSTDYMRIGVIKPTEMVYQMLENKHGVDNPVIDLKVSSAILGPVIFDGSDVTAVRTYLLQDQDGTIALQEELTLNDTQVLFAGPTGLIIQSSDFIFNDSTDTLTVPNIVGGTTIKASNLTAGRVVFAGASGLLTDDADMTFATATLTVTNIVASTSLTNSALTSGRVTFASTGGLLADAAGLAWDGTNFTATQVRSSNLTAGRVVFAGASGLLSDDSDMTFAGSTLTVTNLVVGTGLTNSALTSGRIVIAGTAGLLGDDADLTFTGGNTLNTARLNVGTTSTLLGLLTATATLNFGNTLAGTSSDLTITVTGAAVGDAVFISTPAAPDADSCFTAWVSAADTVTVRFNNYSVLPIDPGSGTYRAVVAQF